VIVCRDILVCFSVHFIDSEFFPIIWLFPFEFHLGLVIWISFSLFLGFPFLVSPIIFLWIDFERFLIFCSRNSLNFELVHFISMRFLSPQRIFLLNWRDSNSVFEFLTHLKTTVRSAKYRFVQDPISSNYYFFNCVVLLNVWNHFCIYCRASFQFLWLVTTWRISPPTPPLIKSRTINVLLN